MEISVKKSFAQLITNMVLAFYQNHPGAVSPGNAASLVSQYFLEPFQRRMRL